MNYDDFSMYLLDAAQDRLEAIAKADRAVAGYTHTTFLCEACEKVVEEPDEGQFCTTCGQDCLPLFNGRMP